MMTRIHVASDDCLIFLIFLCSFQMQTYATGPCKDKYRVFPEHSACLPKSPKAKPGLVNINDALAVHNRYRLKAAQKYKTTNMLKMVWDSEVATVAQKWAENCDISHDGNYQRLIPGKFSVGQNIAGGQSPLSWETVVQLFYNESKDFALGSKHNRLEKVGHFTQLTWAESYILGCGYAVCDVYHFYVCNYAPSGNHAGELGNPFETNDTGQTNLIDCDHKICEGGSRLDPATCTCKCPTDYYHKSLNFLKSADNRCQLTCVQDLKEKFFCGSKGYAEKSCLHLSNVPFDCPKTCHICPYADPSYKEGSTAIITLENSSGDARTVTLSIPAFVLFVTFSHCWFHLYTSN